jgi:hydrogenase-1 operon protein HyaF
MNPFPIPVVPFGRGSQPADEGLDYPRMPAPEPVARPRPPETAPRRDRLAAAEVIERLLGPPGGEAFGRFPGTRVALAGMAPGARHALDDSLGQGEVSAIAEDGGQSWHVQETAFCGVWRVQRVAGTAEVAEDLLEVGAMPQVVRRAARPGDVAPPRPRALPEGVMNAPAVLAEIRDRARRLPEGAPAHVINLSHLPFNDADHAALAGVLGDGRVTILSRGFGNCRIAATGLGRVWRVQYFNSMSTLILDTIEVVDVPEAALANDDDFAESRARLRELVEWLREP